jgi:hypothetical protein
VDGKPRGEISGARTSLGRNYFRSHHPANTIRPTPSTALFPYYVHDKMAFPSHFQNQGEEYYNDQSSQVDRLLTLAEKAPEKNRAAVFYSCPEKSDFCRIVLSIHSENLSDPNQPFEVEAEGIPIALSTRWVGPFNNRILKRPFVIFECTEGRSKTRLAQKLGFSEIGKENGGHSSLQAPFIRTVQAHCEGRVRSIRLGFEDSTNVHAFDRLRSGKESRLFDLSVNKPVP